MDLPKLDHHIDTLMAHITGKPSVNLNYYQRVLEVHQQDEALWILISASNIGIQPRAWDIFLAYWAQ